MICRVALAVTSGEALPAVIASTRARRLLSYLDPRRQVFPYGPLVQHRPCGLRVAAEYRRGTGLHRLCRDPWPSRTTTPSRLAAGYDAAVLAADPADVGSGRTTTRVWDFINGGPDFDGLYVYQPILEACCRVIAALFHLSTMHARAVNPGAPAQNLHADYRRTTDAWPMVGFIFMVDEFRLDNGATRFVPS